MYRIKTANKISEGGLSLFKNSDFEVGDGVSSPDGILVRSQDLHSIEFNDNLRAIARAGAGVNNIPVSKCSEKGVVVFNTPGANAGAVCEIALCALFLASRKIVEGVEWAKTLADKGDEAPALVEKGKGAFVGPEISGKTLGVIGLGAIGVRVANACNKLEMSVYGYDPYISVAAAWKLSRYVEHATTLDAIWQNCDYITLHLPYMESTRHIINKKALDSMRDGVKILNFARGELVNDEDMVAALKSGKVSRYITDFPNARLLKEKNVIAIPHLGASTPESEENCAVMAAGELKDYLLYGNIKNSVNFPDMVLERGAGRARLCLIHKNIKGELNNILSLLSGAGLNVENMINKSKGDYAYTMIDLNESLADGILEGVKKLPDMIRVRVMEWGGC